MPKITLPDEPAQAALGRGVAKLAKAVRGTLGPQRMNAEPTFEETQAELERIVERLERGDVELEELTRLWERGEELYRRCAAQLSEAQGNIEELAQRLHGG